jgi:hypothetical protein
VIDLDRRHALGAGTIEAFRANGFVRLKRVFSAEELGHYAREIERRTLAKLARPLEERSTYGKAFLQVTNLWEQGGLSRESCSATGWRGSRPNCSRSRASASTTTSR